MRGAGQAGRLPAAAADGRLEPERLRTRGGAGGFVLFQRPRRSFARSRERWEKWERGREGERERRKKGERERGTEGERERGRGKEGERERKKEAERERGREIVKHKKRPRRARGLRRKDTAEKGLMGWTGIA